jgi:hypothetical protein
MATKAAVQQEIETELSPLEQENKELREQLAKTQQQLKDALKQGEGWLITTDNPLYDGVMFGISFVNGAAFIGVEQHVAFFEIQPESDESIKKRHMHLYTYALTEKERERAAERIQNIITKQRQREAMSTAERAVLEITKRKGYKAEFFSADHLADLQGRMSERANQRRQAEAALRAKINAENIFPPGYVKAQ